MRGILNCSIWMWDEEFPACRDVNCTGSTKPGKLHLKILKESVNLSENNNCWLSLVRGEHWLVTRSVIVDGCQKEMVHNLLLDALSLFTANGEKYSGFLLIICKRGKLLKLWTTWNWKHLQNYWRAKLFENTFVKCRKWLQIFDGNMCKRLCLERYITRTDKGLLHL